jgi:hypothetical protein
MNEPFAEMECLYLNTCMGNINSNHENPDFIIGCHAFIEV